MGNIPTGTILSLVATSQGFTDTEDRNGKLWVFDFRVNKLFNPDPRGVALETNFNKIDLPGYAPDYLEENISPTSWRERLYRCCAGSALIMTFLPTRTSAMS